MKRLKRRLRRLSAHVKDRASLVNKSPLREAVVRATTHRERIATESLFTLLIEGLEAASWQQATRCLDELIKRLQATRSWAVALKALIVLHRLSRDAGPFIQDQIGRHAALPELLRYLLNDFKDRYGGSLTLTWHVRRYARYLHTRFLAGVGHPRSPSAATDAQIGRELAALADVLGEARECLGSASAAAACSERTNTVVLESARVVAADGWRVHEEIAVFVEEVRKRILSLRAETAAKLLETAECLAERQAAFLESLNDSPLQPVVGGRGTVSMAGRVRERLLPLMEALRAVAGIKAAPGLPSASAASSWSLVRFQRAPVRPGRCPLGWVRGGHSSNFQRYNDAALVDRY